MKKIIYLDNAATTKTSPEVLEAMLPYFTENYGNPSAIYSIGSANKEVINNARGQIASVLGAKENEIYFTAGGSESDNWALKATAELLKDKGRHIITSAIEHHAILHTCDYLEKQGFEITYIGVDENGKVKLDELKAAIREDTILISVMFANNEIGTIQPIKEIGEIAHEHGIYFHTDAVQAYAHIPINVDEYNIDMMSASGHKFYGPKGIGFLYIRTGVKIGSFVHGGAQERKRRAGTENVPGIVGMAKAAEMAHEKLQETVDYEMEVAYKRTSELLDSGREFTALFAVSDAMAIAAMKALHDAGRKVPDECSVIAIDGITMSQYTVPTLTTLVQPKEELGEKAVKLLVNMIEGKAESRQVHMETTLRPGGTIGRMDR